MALTRKYLILLFVIFYLASTCLIYNSNIVWAIQPENMWVSKTELPQTDMGIMAASVNGKIYVMGGSVNLEFNPATNSWVSKTPMLTPRVGVGITVYQNKIYTIGGSIGWTQETGTIQSNVNEVYDPSTDTWETKKPMPTNNSYLGTTAVDSKIHLIGSGVHYVYNIALDTWSTEEVSSLFLNFGYGSATTVFDNKIYFINWNQTLIYDPISKQWSSGSSLPTPVYYTGVCSTTGEMATKQIYVIGGKTGGGMFTAGSDLVQVYDPNTNRWTLGASMPTGRLSLTVAVANDKIYAFAGRGALVFSGDLTVNEEYTPFGYGTPDTSDVAPTSTPTPTVPEFSIAIIITLVIVITLTFSLVSKKQNKTHVPKEACATLHNQTATCHTNQSANTI